MIEAEIIAPRPPATATAVTQCQILMGKCPILKQYRDDLNKWHFLPGKNWTILRYLRQFWSTGQLLGRIRWVDEEMVRIASSSSLNSRNDEFVSFVDELKFQRLVIFDCVKVVGRK